MKSFDVSFSLKFEYSGVQAETEAAAIAACQRDAVDEVSEAPVSDLIFDDIKAEEVH